MSAEQDMTEMPVVPAPQTSNGAADEGGNGGGYELDENGQRVSHGMGQSKSSRRRRRKRKGKGADSGGSGEGEAQVSEGGGHIVSSMAGEGTPQNSSGESNGNQMNSDAQPASSGYQAAGAPPSTQGGFRQNGGRNQQNNATANPTASGAPGGTKRWKKKFRDRDRPGPGGQSGQQNGTPQSQQNGGGGMQQNASNSQGNGSGAGFRGADTHQPGNSTGGFKRKGGFGGGGGKQGRSSGGGGRSGGGGFVGPMDHSYRVVNGNVFEPGGATQSFSNGGGGGRGRGYQSDSQPIDYSQGRVVPIAEGTPTHIYFFIDDLFFTAKIQETARKLGVKVAFIKNEKEQIAQLVSGEDEDRPSLIVFDLNNANAKPMTLIPKIKTKLKKTVSIIGFLSHLQGDLKAKAVEAGCDTVMPRAAFSQNLPNLLRRYGLEDTDETNYNQ